MELAYEDRADLGNGLELRLEAARAVLGQAGAGLVHVEEGVGEAGVWRRGRHVDEGANRLGEEAGL